MPKRRSTLRNTRGAKPRIIFQQQFPRKLDTSRIIK
jgi:hypothetical protein